MGTDAYEDVICCSLCVGGLRLIQSYWPPVVCWRRDEQRASALLEEVNVALVSESSIACMSGNLVEDLRVDESCDEVIRRRICRVRKQLNVVHGDDWMVVKMLEDLISVRGGAAKLIRDFPSMVLAQIKNAPRSVRRLRAYINQPAQEERKPLLPIACIAHALQAVIVLLTVPFEVVRQVEDRLHEHLLFA